MIVCVSVCVCVCVCVCARALQQLEGVVLLETIGTLNCLFQGALHLPSWATGNPKGTTNFSGGAESSEYGTYRRNQGQILAWA